MRKTFWTSEIQILAVDISVMAQAYFTFCVVAT